MSLINPDVKILQNLNQVDDEVLNWLKANLEKEREQTSILVDEVVLRKAQGRAQVLSELVEYLEGASALLLAERKKQAENHKGVPRYEPGEGAY